MAHQDVNIGVGSEITMHRGAKNDDLAEAVLLGYLPDGASRRLLERWVKGAEKGRVRVRVPTGVSKDPLDAAAAYRNRPCPLGYGRVTVKHPVRYLVPREPGNDYPRLPADCSVEGRPDRGSRIPAQDHDPPDLIVPGESHTRIRPKGDREVAIRGYGASGNRQEAVHVLRRCRDRVEDSSPGLVRRVDEAGTHEYRQRLLHPGRRHIEIARQIGQRRRGRLAKRDQDLNSTTRREESRHAS